MSTAKFERLIDLIINEDQEKAEQLFHEIVVEKSRQIYEGLMDEEMMDEDMTSDLLDEIEMEETADMTMEDEMQDEEMSGDYDVESDEMDEEAMDDEESMDDEEVDMEMSDEEDFADADMGSEEPASKSDVMDLEDKLDQLLAAFEEEFGSEEEGEEEEEEESGVMEAVEMKKVPVTHADGSDSGSKRGPVAANSGARGMASKPVKFSGDDESVPTSPKAPSNEYSKGEGQVKGAGQFKNAPGVNGSKTENAPKPVRSQASGVNTKDVVPESRQIKKKMVR